MGLPILLHDAYIAAGHCQQLVECYTKARTEGLFEPNGVLCTDIPLALVERSCRLKTCCGVKTPKFRELRQRVAEEIGKHFRIEGLLPDYSAYTCVAEGGSHTLHADGVTLEGKPNHTAHRVATGILYLNDGGTDFDGGEIVFPAFGITITPRPGRLIGLPCSLPYRHEVKLVTRGRRDALIFWLTRDAKHREYWPGEPRPA